MAAGMLESKLLGIQSNPAAGRGRKRKPCEPSAKIRFAYEDFANKTRLEEHSFPEKILYF